MPLLFEVKVVPSSGRNKWVLEKSGKLKCYLKNPPEKGKANKELIKLIAKALSLAQGKIAIVSGATNRNKLVKIESDFSYDQLLQLLGIERQKSLLE